MNLIARLRKLSSKSIGRAVSLRTTTARQAALAYARLGAWQYRTSHRLAAWRTWFYVALGSLAVAGIFFSVPWIESVIDPLITNARIPSVQQAILGLGSALVGATVLTFTFIMFALQVNVERMPHGLFRRLSSDSLLLLSFLAAFVIAIFVLALSAIDSKEYIVVGLILAIAGTAVIISLVLYSYTRALKLINPIQQLEFVLQQSGRILKVWHRRATRVAPLIVTKDSESIEQSSRTDFDVRRFTFFQLNRGWTDKAQEGIQHAIALARYYAEHGDHEVSEAAIQTIIGINSAYVEAKGRTFVGQHLFLDSPLTTDAFLNETLEALRQIVQSGVARVDERQIEQAFRGFGGLAFLYLSIRYGSENDAKHHARLVAGYLETAIESVIPHNMADVLIEGARVLGNVSVEFVRRDNEVSSTAGPVQCLTRIAISGIKNESYRAVSQVAVGELARLTLAIISLAKNQYAFSVKNVRDSVMMLAGQFMLIEERPMQSPASQCLGSYFSLTATNSLPSNLRVLVNGLLESEADNLAARQVIMNIGQWAHQLYSPYRDLLQTAIRVGSLFAIELVQGIRHYAILLTALSTAKACDNYTQGELRKQAEWLVWGFTYIPGDKDAITRARHSTLLKICLRLQLKQNASKWKRQPMQLGKYCWAGP